MLGSPFRSADTKQKIFAVRHPIDSSGTEILLEEAYLTGARKILRIGSCYGINVTTGDIVIPEEVILGDAGVAKARGYFKGDILKFDKYLVKKLKENFSKLGTNFYSGRIISDDYFNAYLTQQKKWLKDKLLANEVECSEFPIFSNIHKNIKVAAILIANGCMKRVKSMNQKEKETAKKNYQIAVKIGFDILAKQ